GLKLALDTANAMDDYWVKHPEIGAGLFGGTPLLQGGGVLGAFVNLILNPDTKLSWKDVRAFAARGAIGAAGCSDFDTRDSGYLGAWLTMAANYDPDPALRGQWKNQLTLLLARD